MEKFTISLTLVTRNKNEFHLKLKKIPLKIEGKIQKFNSNYEADSSGHNSYHRNQCEMAPNMHLMMS
jgi:hypothetical protein